MIGLRIGFLAILVFAPLAFGGVVGWSTAAMSAACGLLLAITALAHLRRQAAFPSGCGRIAMAAGVLATPAALQLVPLPPALLAWLSPATSRFYVTAGAGSGWLPLSQDPAATAASAGWILTCAAAAFLTAALFDARSVRGVLVTLLALGTGEAFYGLLQSLSGWNRIFLYEKKHYLDSVTGTYINRNHFAALMVMLLPVGFAWLLAKTSGRHRQQATGIRQRLLALADPGAGKILILMLALALMGAGLALSLSRAGITLGLLALIVPLAAGGFGARSTGGRRPWAAAGLWFALLVGTALVPLAARGSGRLATALEDIPAELSASGGRPAVWSSTLSMAADHPLLGTGLGTFSGVFPRYRPSGLAFVYSHAHQDYLQWLAETGLVGVMLGAAALACVGWLGFGALRRSAPPLDRALALGLLAGLGGLGLHGLVDFNSHIPANALLASVLLACLIVLARPTSGEVAA